MNIDLTTSEIARNNVLNNPYALAQLENSLELRGLEFEEETVFTKGQLALILDIDERTIDRYLNSHGSELQDNGYRIAKDKRLKTLKLLYVDDTGVVDISPKTPALGLFNFRALLNLAMLVTESERSSDMSATSPLALPPMDDLRKNWA